MINLYIAVILENFSEPDENESNVFTGIATFAEQWSKCVICACAPRFRALLLLLAVPRFACCYLH